MIHAASAYLSHIEERFNAAADDTLGSQSQRMITSSVDCSCCLFVQPALAQLPFSEARISFDFHAAAWRRWIASIADEIANKRLPGAVVLVGRKGRIVWRKAYGARAVEPARETMTADTIFDVASLTKVVATATSIMILVERGQVRLNDPVSLHIPELKGEGRERITIEQLLTHVSGYAPDFDLRERWTGYDEAIKRLIKEPLRNPPGTRFIYSDIGFIALGEVVARVSGMPLDQFAQKNIFVPLRNEQHRLPSASRR